MTNKRKENKNSTKKLLLNNNVEDNINDSNTALYPFLVVIGSKTSTLVIVLIKFCCNRNSFSIFLIILLRRLNGLALC